MTLVEVLVVVALLGVVLAMAQGAVSFTQRTVSDDLARNDQSSQARVAVGTMTRHLRTAILPKQLDATCTGCDVAAFISGDAQRVAFYANHDNDYSVAIPAGTYTRRGPSKVSYVLSGGVLTETLQRPNLHLPDDYNFTYCAPGPSCTIQTRVIARGVPSGTNIFTYYANDGSQVAIPLESATSRLKAVDSIDIVLSVKSSPRAKASTVATRIALPNADSLVQATPEP
jgi:type II secretory pathway pseudopilin PulG